MSIKSASLLLATLSTLNACGNESPPEIVQPAYVLASAEVRQEDPTLTVAPLEVASDELVEVGGQAIALAPGVVSYLPGHGSVVPRIIGVDIADDRVILVASAEAARRLAEAIGGTVRELEPGTFELQADQVWALLDPELMDGVSEILPVDLDQEVHAQAIAAGQAMRPVLRASLGIPAAAFVSVDRPVAVTCEDAVAGTWSGRRHRDDGMWYEFVLELDARGRGYKGHVIVRSWFGEESDVKYVDDRLTLPAVVELAGSALSVRETKGDAFYNPDHFTGTIDPGAGTFAAVNNDGGYAVDAPVTFTRTACR